MARGQDLLFAHHGNSNEDNATKNLCWLLNFLPQEVSVELLRPFVKAFKQESLLGEINPEDIEVIAQESAEVTKRRTGRKVLLGLAAKGHSHSETKIKEFTPENNNKTSKSIPDLVIQLSDELVIAIEAKDGGFNCTQLQNHARWLSAERFETIMWEDIANQFHSVSQSWPTSGQTQESITGSSVPSASIDLLLNEYEKILRDQLIPQGQIIASSEYTKGKNYVKARRDVGSDKLTGRVADKPNQSLPVPVAICFRASGEETNGQRLWFSREEWISLLKSISNPDYHRGLARGNLSEIVADYDPSNERDITIAHIEDSEGDEKMILYGTGKGERTNDTLFMNRSTAAGSNLQVPPMYTPDEFDELFADNDQMRRLFTNPNAVFDELKRDL